MKTKMMRRISAFVVAGLFAFNASAQNAHEVSVSINKETKTAFQADYPVSDDLIKITLEDRLRSANLPKGKSAKGYTLYKEVVFPELSTNKIDIYTKVDGKKTNATIVMLVATGYDNFISSSNDAATAANVIAFLNRLVSDAATMQIKINIANQEDVVKNAEKELKKTNNDNADLLKDKEKIEKKIVESNSTVDKASKSLDAERAKLESLKASLGK
jgi:hypothetical protein